MEPGGFHPSDLGFFSLVSTAPSLYSTPNRLFEKTQLFFGEPSSLFFADLGRVLLCAPEGDIRPRPLFFADFSRSPRQPPPCRHATVITRTMSSTLQPRERSFIGLARPCRNGPYASARPSRSTSL